MHISTNLCVYWVCSIISPKGPWLRYPCHVTPKDSQRSASGGTEGPQMELHQLTLLCPSAVISPSTQPLPSHHLTPWGARPPYLHTLSQGHTGMCMHSGYTRVNVHIAIHIHAEWINEGEHAFRSVFKWRSAECFHVDPLAAWRTRRESRWSGVCMAWDLSHSLSLSPFFIMSSHWLSTSVKCIVQYNTRISWSI